MVKILSQLRSMVVVYVSYSLILIQVGDCLNNVAWAFLSNLDVSVLAVYKPPSNFPVHKELDNLFR